MRGLAFVTLLLCAFRPTTVAAQGCAEGRQITERTEGRCCWPGQHWNADEARCEGPPDCPAGWGAAGDQCELTRRTRAPRTSAPDSPELDSPELDSPELVILEPRSLLIPEESHPDYGFIAAGSIVLFVSYVPTAVLGPLTGSWAAGVPVIGGFLWPITDVGFGLIVGLPLSAVQTFGFVMLVYGLATWNDPEGESATWAPEVVPGPGEVGLGLEWRL